MSDNQMIKIEFDFDLGNVPASAKKFSEYLKGVGVDLEFTKKSVKQLGDSIEQTAQKMNNAGGSIKKSNQQWTNFSLIIQDLPYGFRAIQNNLPAVLGSIAGAAGPIYLIGSAVVAFFAAVDNGLIKFGESTKVANDYAKEFASTLAKETVEFSSLYRVATDSNRSMEDRIEAAKALKKEYPGLLSNFSEEEITLGKAKSAYDKLSASVLKYAKAQAATSILTELTKKQLILEKEKADLLDKYRKDPISKYTNEEVGGIKALYGETSKYNTELNIRTYELKKNGAAWNAVQKDIDKYNNILDDNIIGEKELDKYKQKTNDKKAKLNQDDSLLKKLKAEEQLYKDDMFMKRAIGLEIVNEEERLAVEKAKFEKASDKELLNIADEYKFKRLAIEKETKDGIQEINNTYADERAKEQAKRDKEAFDAAKAAKNRELQNALDAIKIESDTRQKFHKKDRAQIDQDLKAEMDALFELAATGIYSAEQFDKITDAIIRVDAAIQGNKAHLKEFNIDWIDTLNNINGVIMDFINNSIFTLADSLGKVLGGETVDMVSAFGMLIADALQQIGKQLIAFATAWLFTFALMADPNPISAAAALAAGIAAVAIGSLIKSGLNKKQQVNTPKFANGGIISGPTYGLMGEYPGAKSNPEVVAPLDKLKSMIGGGGSGEFVLRGNDLVLALQRSNSSLTLRR
jgi:hypothetical protein